MSKSLALPAGGLLMLAILAGCGSAPKKSLIRPVAPNPETAAMERIDPAQPGGAEQPPAKQPEKAPVATVAGKSEARQPEAASAEAAPLAGRRAPASGAAAEVITDDIELSSAIKTDPSLISPDALMHLFENNTLYTTLPHSEFVGGGFDGVLSVDELLRLGSFGLGVFNSLDGVMVLLDGKAYRIYGDGSTRSARGMDRLPYALVTSFSPDDKFNVPEVRTLDELVRGLSERLPGSDEIYAIRLEGVFRYVRAASFMGQQKPYTSYGEALGVQSNFLMQNVRGTVVGFSIPGDLTGVDGHGMSMYFITEDRKAGGRLLNCWLMKATVEVDSLGEFRMVSGNDDTREAAGGRQAYNVSGKQSASR